MSRTSRVLCRLAFILIAPGELHAVQVEKLASDRAPEIEAKCWFNAQPARIHDAPKLILLEFWSVRSRESREFVESLTHVYEAYRDGRLLIVALSEDKCEDARGFINREKIPYKVGAESRSAKDYGVKELPGVVLIDPKDARVVGRWSGREVKAKTIAKAIQDFLGPPTGAVPSSGALPPEEREQYLTRVEETGNQLGAITSQILSLDGEIPPQALSPLDRFYEANLPGDPNEDNAVTRAQGVARSEMVDSEEAGYEKLFASGRLSEAAKTAIRDRVLQIAEKDPEPGVRMSAFTALRMRIGRPGDVDLLNALRGLREREPSPFVRASIDHALENLDPAQAANREDLTLRPIALNLRRMLNESHDPASSPWADAHAYKQTAPQRSTEQLLEDYRAFPDPPNDEIGRQNATLKRDTALDELENKILRGEIRDLRPVKDQLARALAEDPDPFIRKYAIWSGLRIIAARGESGFRTEIIDLFEKQLPVEPHREVKATLEAAISELKGK